MPGQRAWDQRDGEPAKAYALFLLYRSMGVGRKVRDVAEKCGVKESTIVKLANRFAWVHRADQWDSWALQQRSHASEKRVLREAELEARTVSDLIRMTRILVRRTLREVNRKDPVTNKYVVKLTPAGAANLGDVVVKLSRLQRGEVTDRREQVAKTARERMAEKIDRVAKILADRVKPKVEEPKPDVH